MDEMRAVRDKRYKLIRYPQIDHTQLFDLMEDPDELNNLVEDPDQAENVERLSNLLRQWQEQVGDGLPLTVADLRPLEIDLAGRARELDKWQPDWIVEKYFDSGR
jgi:arylsulfatase A-like enzyme